MKIALLAFLAIPGSGAVFVLAIRELIRAVKRSREDEEDSARALRIQRDYMVPDYAVEVPEPTGRRAVRMELPEITSRYTEETPR